MSTSTEHRKLAAVMFTDMVGYSALAQRDEALALELLEEHRRVVRESLPRHGGREVKTTGDGFLIEFPSALAAVQGAVQIQQSLHERNERASPERRVRIRIGIHVGDVIEHEGDVIGDGVNIAARIEPLAQPGGICVSEDVARQVRNKLTHPLVTLGPGELKHIELPVVICRIVLPWEASAPGPSRREEAQSLRSGNQSLLTPAAARILAVLLLLVLAGGILSWIRNASDTGAAATLRVESLAVLPLANLSNDPSQDYFADGMTDLLISQLSRLKTLQVRSFTSVMRYKRKEKSLADIARELNVQAVLEGSVMREGQRVRINAQLIHASTDQHLWTDTYERDARDVLTLQSDVALAIAREIRLQLTPQEQAGLVQARSVKPEALDAVLKGRFHWRKLTEPGLSNAFHAFRQAIALDSTYAPAYAGLADCFALAGGLTLPPREAWPKVKEHAQKALELDDTLADGYASRGNARMFSDWDWVGAEKDFQRAIELSPNTALFRDYYAGFLTYMGRFDEAISQENKALELERLSPFFRHDLAFCYLFKRDYKRAILEAREAVALDPNFPWAHLDLGLALAMTGRTNEAIAALEKCEQSDPGNPIAKGFLAAGYGFANRRVEALKIFEELRGMATNRYVPVMFYAYIHCCLREHEQALEWLEKAMEAREPGVIALKADPLLDALRSHSHFQTMLARMNFPP